MTYKRHYCNEGKFLYYDSVFVYVYVRWTDGKSKFVSNSQSKYFLFILFNISNFVQTIFIQQYIDQQGYALCKDPICNSKYDILNLKHDIAIYDNSDNTIKLRVNNVIYITWKYVNKKKGISQFGSI